MSTTAPEFGSLREKIAWEKQQREARYAMFAEVFDRAVEAGKAAFDAAEPRPMVVGSPTTPLGDDIDPEKPTYFVADGVCGFAWIIVSPGSSSFARWLVKTGRGSKAYGGGVRIPIFHQGSQSYERKMAYAHAMADVLKTSTGTAGLRIYAAGRLD